MLSVLRAYKVDASVPGVWTEMRRVTVTREDNVFPDSGHSVSYLASIYHRF